MNKLELKGKGFFVFSDPGGAKPVLALCESLEKDLVSYKIITDRAYNFIVDFAVTVDKASGSAIDELKNYRPDFLFTGTSYTSTIELEYLAAAKELSIPSFSFVDHWTSIRERFNNKGTEVFPDHILVVDEKAKEIALKQGIAENNLLVFGNPYHHYLKEWKPAILKEEFLLSLGLGKEGKKVLLYAPDPLSNVDGFLTYGFDELTATVKLSDALKEMTDEYYIVCNFHPNQNHGKLEMVLGKEMLRVPTTTDINTLIFYSDVVVGFFSNLLVEATIMKKPVLRFFEKEGVKDPFENMNIGKVVFPQTIVQELNKIS